MAEQPTPEGAGETQPTPSQGEEFKPIQTQDELNRIVSARVARERQKYSDYDDLKAAAAKLADIEASFRSDLEAMGRRAEAAEAKLGELEQREQHAAWLQEVSHETGVDPRLLHGTTKEEIEASAATYIELHPAQPAGIVPSEGGSGQEPASGGDWLRDEYNRR